MAALLEGKECNDIEVFLKNLGIRALTREALIREWIIPQYSRFDNSKPSVEENHLHLRYLCKFYERWYGVEISETPILRAYSGVQRKDYDFVVPCNAYLPQAYTGNADLETYFSVCDDVWFVDEGYLESDSEPKAWFQFLKKIGAKDVPQDITKKLFATDEECEKRGFDRQYVVPRRQTIGHHHIEDRYFDGLSKVLAEISESSTENFSRALWHLLVKAVPPASAQLMRNKFFRGTYHWFYQYSHQESFDATFYCQLKKTAWLPDEQGKFRSPSELFAPTSENRRVLGDSVAYLPPDIDISNEPARWLAEKLGVHLNADTDNVLKYLQTLSGTTASIEEIEPLYRFLDRQDARSREKFKEESLIFTPHPEPCWWRADQVFCTDESAVFGNRRGYLETHFAKTLKGFFTINLEVPERASPLDYIRVIREVTSAGRADDAEVHKRMNILYRSLWGELQKDDNLSGNETEWEQAREGRCWLGKKGSKWGFFSRHELVWKDHDHRAHLFEGKIPFWEFNDLSDLATEHLGVEGCSQAEVKFHASGMREKDEEDWSDKVRDLRPYIHAFLKSPSLCGQKYEEVKSDQVLDQLSVRLAQKLETTYKLKGIFVSDPEPHPSCLDTTDQEVTLWLGSEADKDEYPELIGDALADYFGIEVLSQFVEGLLSKKDREKVLSRWKRKGLQPDFSPPEAPSEEDKEKLVDTSDEDSTSIVDNSVEDKTEDYSYSPQSVIAGTGSRGGHQGGMSYGGGGGGGHGGGGGEGHTHKALKEYLANKSLSTWCKPEIGSDRVYLSSRTIGWISY